MGSGWILATLVWSNLPWLTIKFYELKLSTMNYPVYVNGTVEGFFIPAVIVRIYTIGATHIAEGQTSETMTFDKTPEVNEGVQE